ncbi:hypothetical protein, conserved [Plasmodium gonderi]|uniref:RAP domain-containing protein n=1 Tax=Plasmodium gonderi TaxID=77519 RepID=A0A1Y1JLP6_PLAGO|nr:hypothetical protein, conserved [Plasmodium gonderi]GAW81742.1 hypothetical protein, conserved [Plasmodium gonderi]
MNILKIHKVITTCLAHLKRNGRGGKCNFSVYNRKDKKKDIINNNKNTNFLKNICNKNVINHLDPINLIENLKYVTECNVNEDIIKNYLHKIKLLNVQWNLNKIYFILKTLVKYNLHDTALMNKLENDVYDLHILCEEKRAEIDPFENVYIVRISYILHGFYYFNYANSKAVEILINILNIKINYIIFHNYYSFPIFNKNDLFDKLGNPAVRGRIPIASSINSTYKKNDEINHILNKADKYVYKDTLFKRKEDVFVRNINFNEIYLILNTMKNLKYTNKDFINKLKFLYYFNCINVDNATENDYKHITLLFHFFYEISDIHLSNIMKFFLSRQGDMKSVHDLVLILVTVYYGEMEKGDLNNMRNNTNAREIKVQSDVHANCFKNRNLGCSQIEDIVNIIEGIYFISNEKKEYLKSILQYVHEYSSVRSRNFIDLIYEKVLHLLSCKYYDEEFEKDEPNNNQLLPNRKFIMKKEPNEILLFRSAKSNELQSLTELIKICIYSFEDVDSLFYIYLKKHVEFFNIDAVLNVLKSFIFVYHMQNESNKNYFNVHLNERCANVIRNNLNNLTSMIIKIISTISLSRLYAMCNLKDLSILLYFLYQISNIFKNQTYEEQYLKKVQDHVDNIVITKLKLFLDEIGPTYHHINDIKKRESKKTKKVCDMNSSRVNMSYGMIEKETCLNEKEKEKEKEVLDNSRIQNYYENENHQFEPSSTNPFNRKHIGIKEKKDTKCYSLNEEYNREVDVYILLLNMYSKRGQSKNVIYILLKILHKCQIESKSLPYTIYVNLLNSFAKLKYRNLNLIGTCLQKINEHAEGLHFYEYTNILISLSKLNIFGVNLHIYDRVFLLKDNYRSSSTYREHRNRIFLNEYNDNSVKREEEVKIICNLNTVLKKINESVSRFVPVPSYQLANIIPNILSSYVILGFDKIDLKNVNKLLECFHDYVFDYFKQESTNSSVTIHNTKPNMNNGKARDFANRNYCHEILTCMNNPLRKKHHWYFSEKNNIIITRKDANRKLYLPIQSLYQIYIFNVYFSAYVEYLYESYKDREMEKSELPNGKTSNDLRQIDKSNISNNLSNFLHNPNLFLKDNQEIKRTPTSNILSERSIHILNNVTFFVKYINRFYKNKRYDEYNLHIHFVRSCKEKEPSNEQLINNVKKCHVHIKRDNSSVQSSSFHREVLSILFSLGAKNVECEVPFLDGIYTVDIVINKSVCIEINGNNHYYFDNNLKRSYEKIDSLNLIKYYLLSKKYRLILVSYLEWNDLKSVDAKQEYLKKKLQV